MRCTTRSIRARIFLQALEERTTPAAYFVTNLNDTGTGSLRDAIVQSNTTSSILDDIYFNVTGIISLTSSELVITDRVNISGPGANLLTIRGGPGATGVFNLGNTPGGEQIVLSGLSVKNGGAQFGGGIHMQDEVLRLIDCTIADNTSSSSGGGIYVGTGGQIIASGNTFSGNRSGGYGGAILFNNGGSLTLNNCTLTGNTATGHGGAVYFYGDPPVGSLTFRNSTITGNSAGNSGGALCQGTAYFRTFNLTSCIVSGNTGKTGPDIFANLPLSINNSAIGSSTGFTFSGSNNLPFGTNLKLGSLADNGGGSLTLLPAVDSPVRDAGSNPGELSTDARGIGSPRTLNAVTDIGALEIRSLVVRSTNDGGKDTLRQQVLDANAVFGPNTITFDPVYFATAKTILLDGATMPPIALTDFYQTTISGPGALLASISGGNVMRPFDIATGANAIISGITITNGRGITEAGGISNKGGLVISDLVLSNNLGESGGAIFNTSNATLQVANTTLRNNTAVIGGGIYNNGTLNLLNSTVHANSSYNTGGGITSTSNFTVYNSTVSGNTASSGGGGLFLGGNPATVDNTTIVLNVSGGSGGGIATALGSFPVNIVSSIVSNNTGLSSPDIASVNTVNVTWSAIGDTTGFSLTGANNLPIGSNLKLAALVANGGPTFTHMPAIDSPLRSQGSNPGGLTQDQRGLPRVASGAIDIGAVEVNTTSVTNILRIGPNPTNLPSGLWSIEFADSLTGLSASNFALTGPGAVGASITDVSVSGASYLVSVAFGAEGSVGLEFNNSLGLSRLPTNLPYTGVPFFVDKVALTATVSPSTLMVNDSKVGTGTYTVTAAYSEPMNTIVNPQIAFPVENPGSSLVFQSGSWSDSKTYVARYNVADLSVNLTNIDIQSIGAVDSYGLVVGTFSHPDAFSIDTANPIVLAVTRNQAINNKLAAVSWGVTFSEAVTGVTSDNFTLFKGGLTGEVFITGVSGFGTAWIVSANTGSSGSGNLGIFASTAASVVDANGNPLAALPLAGPSYALDFVSPAASLLTVSTLTVCDAQVGPNGFRVSAKFNELMDQTVQPSFAFPMEMPAGSVSFSNGVWIDALTWQASFTVADLGTTLQDIDVSITGARDVVGNMQTPIVAVDLFDLDTQNAIITSITSDSPDGTYLAGQTIDVSLNFSEPVSLDGALNVMLSTGAVVSIVGPISGTNLTGTYTVGANQSSMDLNVTAIALTVGSTLTDNATNTSILALPSSNLANNAAIVIGAGVTSIEVNNSLPQRSRLTSINVNFNSLIDVSAIGVVTLTRTSATSTGTIGTMVSAESGLNVNSASGLASSITLTFQNIQNAGVAYGSLTDGYWRLAIPSLNYSSTTGEANLRRLFGDVNNDGTVNGSTDFAQFGNVFGTTVANSPFDFNGDGTIDGPNDFAAFGGRFGITL